MVTRSGKARAFVTVVTAVVLVVLTIVVPLLDRGQAPGAMALADEDAPAGVLGHHHGICLQHSAAAWIPGPSDPGGFAAPETDDPVPPLRPYTPPACPHSSYRSRAPPAA